ncbi:hypothetical protein [Streptomyces sp. NPDC060322]|uniref:hypothetical protein n=1 Tax=Streptomyces sp. NPDC060322 TaxID=3347097 RepID=UPI003666C156
MSQRSATTLSEICSLLMAEMWPGPNLETPQKPLRGLIYKVDQALTCYFSYRGGGM